MTKKRTTFHTSTKLKKSTRKPKPARRAWSADTILYLTQDELRRLLKAIDNPRDYAIFLLADRHGVGNLQSTSAAERRSLAARALSVAPT